LLAYLGYVISFDALGIEAASFCEVRTKDIADSPTAMPAAGRYGGNAIVMKK